MISDAIKYVVAVAFVAVLLLLLCWQITNVIRGMRKAQGTLKQRFMAAFSDSLTILWARIVAFGGAGLGAVTTAIPFLDPSSGTGQVFSALFTADTLKYWVAGITAIGLVTEWVRRRPGSIDPITPPAQAKP